MCLDFLKTDIRGVSKFKGEVVSYDWEDHHSPPLLMLFKIWCDMYNYLLNPNHVVIVHWNAGKGRTGTSIAWFLIYSGLSETSQDAIRYYGRKRFSTGLGITQPWQIRYVRYFELVYRGIVISPSMWTLREVKMHTVPHLNGKTCKPYMELVSIINHATIYTGKYDDNLKTYKDISEKQKKSKNLYEEQKAVYQPSQNFVHVNTISQVKGHKSLGILTRDDTLASETKNKKKPKIIPFDLSILGEDEDENAWHNIPQKKNQLLIGDILLRIKHKGAFSNPSVCRIWFNTAFIFNNQIKYSIKDIDPVSIRKDDRFSPDFSITLVTEPFWTKWNSQTPISKFCNSWNINFESEIKRWKKIHEIIDYHKTTYKGVLTSK